MVRPPLGRSCCIWLWRAGRVTVEHDAQVKRSRWFVVGDGKIVGVEQLHHRLRLGLVPDLAQVLVGPSKPAVGDVLTYTLSVGNRGPATAKTVKVTDSLPEGLEYVSASLPAGSCSAAGPVLTCQLAALAAGASKTATVRARSVAPGSVKNTASVSAAHADAKQADNHDTAAAYVRSAGAVLHLVKKRLGHGAVEAGQTVKFRIPRRREWQERRS